MNNRLTAYLRVILTLSFFVLLSVPTFAQKSGVMGALDYTSIVQISSSNAEGTGVDFLNPYTNLRDTFFAGLLKGTLNSVSTKFYCIDINTRLARNEDYWDEGNTPSEITYILNNYFPFKTSYSGMLSNLNKEAAAIQFAIWHFSDNVDLNEISGSNDIENRAIAIVADANANHANVVPLQSLLILPSFQSLAQGTNASFDIYALDLNGNPISGLAVNISSTIGSLSTATGTTNASGHVGPITLTYSGTGTATIKVKANVAIPQGTRYVYKAGSNLKQKLVLATPTFDTKEEIATVTWYIPGSPGTCDTRGFTTFTQGGWGSPSNSTPGKIRDLYFSTVFPSGLTVGGTFKLTLTSAATVMNYLPDGGTAAAYTQNYTNPTNNINVLSGQLTALKLNVAYDAAGKIGNNSTNLGDLVIVTGPFTGMTVNAFMAFAETAIGGGSLNGFTFSQINDAATAINENFDNGKNDKGFLKCEDEQKASLGDKVWEDLNKNGLQDQGESGIPNVTVKLFDLNNNLVATTTTDQNGNYLFSNLNPGKYYVQFIKLSGYFFSIKDASSNSSDALDSDADITTGKTALTELTAGENDLIWDAGLYKETSKVNLGDFVWHDKNLNGIQESGEPGILGAVVELIQNNTVIATTTTDINGKYLFANLLQGTYGVRVANSNYNVGGALYSNAQQKWYSTKKNQGSDDSKDSDANKGETVTVTLTAQDDLTIDFGYYKTCVTITKSADKPSYKADEVITYTFVVENCGDVTHSGGVDVYDKMLNPNGDNKIKHIDKLEPGKSYTFTMQYTITEKDCGKLINTVRADGHPVDGSADVTDESSWSVEIICDEKSDVRIEKTVDNANPKNGDEITFTIKVTNDGPNTAKNIEVTDLLPSGLIYLSSTASQGSFNSSTGVWTVGNLANSAFATLTIRVKVDAGLINNSAFDLGAAKDYNLFVIEDLNQPSSDTQGKVAVGRDAQFAAYSIGDQLPPNSSDVLIVERDLTFTSGAVYNGNVVYGHATNLPQSSVSITGGTLRKDTPINFAAAKAYLENLSTTLAAYTVNGTTSSQWGGLTLTGSDPYLNVFKVNGSDLSSANNFEINVPNGSVVLVNISGTTVSWTGGLVVNGTAINNVLYNFYQATALTISGIDIKGSILAPFAAVNFISGVQNGQMICKSLTGMGQFNLAMFIGHIPVEKRITNVATITAISTIDPNLNNNSSGVTITVSNTSTGGNNGGGNNGSGNNEGSWTNVFSFAQGEIIYTLAYGNAGVIYAGTMGGKIYKSTDGGKTWVRINTGMNVSFIWSLNISGGIIYAATEQGVYKYNGSSWLLTSLSGKDVKTLASYNGILYAGTWGFGIFKSTDFGATWTQINNGLGAFLAVQALTITNNGNVFAGTAGGGVFKSTDGINWNKLSCDYNVIWALGSTSTAVFAGTYGDGLHKSLDGGASWTKVTSLGISFVYSISVDLSGKVYVSSLTNGVFVSSDNGNSWSSLGMGGFGVSSLMVNPGSSDVYVGTKEGKVFSISSNGGLTSAEEETAVPTEFELAQNYPNPFNPSTTIQFAVPVAGNYSLKVYNIIGQEVANLIQSELTAGVHKINFDASRLASGMYIYRLSGKNVNISKKMVLMK